MGEWPHSSGRLTRRPVVNRLLTTWWPDSSSYHWVRSLTPQGPTWSPPLQPVAKPHERPRAHTFARACAPAFRVGGRAKVKWAGVLGFGVPASLRAVHWCNPTRAKENGTSVVTATLRVENILGSKERGGVLQVVLPGGRPTCTNRVSVRANMFKHVVAGTSYLNLSRRGCEPQLMLRKSRQGRMSVRARAMRKKSNCRDMEAQW